MGLALIGNGTAPAGSVLRTQIAKQTGVAITKLVADSIQPSIKQTKNVFNNAITTLCAINGSLDCVVHLIALSQAIGVNISYETVSTISQKTPTLLALHALGQSSTDLHKAGGIGAILNELKSLQLIDTSVHTVANTTLDKQIIVYKILNTDVIYSAQTPYLNHGSICILKGNIAELGAICRRTLSNHNKLFSGKAKVFDSAKEAATALMNGNNINPGDCIVVKFEGPKGGPGLRDLFYLSALLKGYQMQDSVAIVTDGRFSFADGISVGFVSPEVSEEGKLASIKDGDKVVIDMVKGKIEVDLSTKEIANRIKKFDFKATTNRPWLHRYSKLVSGANFGAVLKK
jgi:dihydroxy-acid dehydratase